MSRNFLLKAGTISEALSDSKWIRTHNHLVRKRTLNHLAKLAVGSNPVAVNKTQERIKNLFTKLCLFRNFLLFVLDLLCSENIESHNFITDFWISLMTSSLFRFVNGTLMQI